MAQLNAFHAHILEACAQRDLTEPEALRQVKAMGYGGLECDCRQLTEERRQWFDDCGLKVASVYENYDFGYAPREENERQIRRHLERAVSFGAKKVLFERATTRQRSAAGWRRSFAAWWRLPGAAA